MGACVIKDHSTHFGTRESSREFRQQPGSMEAAAVLADARSRAPPAWPALFRRELYPFATDATPTTKPVTEFSVMQFNVLADGMTVDFEMSPPDSLQWPARSWRLIEEMLRFSPDIICGEEVNHYPDFFEPVMRRAGYECVFMSKPASPCLEFNAPPDGCAVFVRKAKFDIMYIDKFQLVNDHNQVGIILKLAPVSHPRTVLCVAVTHLKASKGEANDRKRLEQMNFLLHRLDTTIPADTPIILCGDFNTEPSSTTYAAVVNHPRQLTSLYGPEGAASEPAHTTWKVRPASEFKRTIDYIFHSKHLDPLCRLSIPDAEVPQSRCPCRQYPSDHFALLGHFALLKPS
eukprot:TRINITY_DN5136_c1_g1_i1.p1 TRINITY_DN5136_c1_g1~~TRINITY_DN5136_c1_g1_i1.p1  ORF type:complete len:346 (-),score=109.55 TRINITY_DN5136_c1_g1_i1:620-1657(-)